MVSPEFRELLISDILNKLRVSVMILSKSRERKLLRKNLKTYVILC